MSPHPQCLSVSIVRSSLRTLDVTKYFMSLSFEKSPRRAGITSAPFTAVLSFWNSTWHKGGAQRKLLKGKQEGGGGVGGKGILL